MKLDKDLEIREDMEEADIITKLLEADPEHVPTMVIPLKRLGIPVTIKALTGKQVLAFASATHRASKRRKGRLTSSTTRISTLASSFRQA